MNTDLLETFRGFK